MNLKEKPFWEEFPFLKAFIEANEWDIYLVYLFHFSMSIYILVFAVRSSFGPRCCEGCQISEDNSQ